MEKPKNPVCCPMCSGVQSCFDPTTQKIDALCETCGGAGWVDPGLHCRCGRAATFFDGKHKLWYCGGSNCAPEKHLNGTPIHRHGFPRPVNIVYPSNNDDPTYGYPGGQWGCWMGDC